jgi:outer membrane protein OmpA-like peptidoglycan-associated protein
MKIRNTFFSLIAVSLLVCIVSPSYSQVEGGNRAIDKGLADTHADNITNLNSPADEATPHVSPDEGTLYFSSFRTGKDAIYKATRKSVTEWNNPELFLELPGKERISSLTLSKDGHSAILTASNRKDGIDQTSDIYECDILDGKIQNIRSLGPNVNSPWWDSQPCVSDDGQMLFFTSDRKKGAGGKDIYMCTKNAGGGWSTPTLLSFCTSGDELSPFIASDNQTLYFASDDIDGGFGGYDIYVTYRTGDNSWSAPKNLGAAVNSNANELFFSIPPVEDALYVASDRSGGLGNFDLYRISPNPVKPKPKAIAFRGQVLDAETGMPVRSEPTTNISVSGGEGLANTGSTRQYMAMAPIGRLINVKAGADYYQNGSIEVQAPSAFSEEGFSEDIKLIPAKVKIVGHVTNVFTGKAVAANVFLEEKDANGNVSKRNVEVDPSRGGSAFEFDAKPFATYTISTTVQDYEPYNSPVPIPPKREALITVEKEIRLQPSTIDAVMVFFDLDKSDLKADQQPKMARFIQQVKENPYVKLEALGHTDDQGTEEYNDRLSKSRAEAVVEYLLSQGVPKDQVAIVKGFGKSAPLVFGTSDEARAKNRRVEVRIVGKQ